MDPDPGQPLVLAGDATLYLPGWGAALLAYPCWVAGGPLHPPVPGRAKVVLLEVGDPYDLLDWTFISSDVSRPCGLHVTCLAQGDAASGWSDAGGLCFADPGLFLPALGGARLLPAAADGSHAFYGRTGNFFEGQESVQALLRPVLPL